MTSLLLRRALGLVTTLLVVSLLLFVVMDLLPGDPASIMLGTSASPDTVMALRHELGLDRPVVLRYLAWLAEAFKGNFGRSYSYGVPVAGLLAERLQVTLPLAAMATLISLGIGVPLGALAAIRRGGRTDVLAGLFAQIGIAVPAFWVGLLLILLFSTELGLMPAGGFPGWNAGMGPAIGALCMPALSLALPQASVLSRVTRTAFLDILHEDFIRTAKAKGLRPRTVLWRHCFPHALVPILTILGLQVTFLIAGAVLVENVFNLPGLGRLAFQALSQRDLVVMQTVVLFFALIVIVTNFLVDLSFLIIDPRLRDPRS